MSMRRVLAVLALVCLGMAAAAPEALAAPVPSKNCNLSTNGDMKCYSTPSAAIRAGTHGRINVPDNATTYQIGEAIIASSATPQSRSAGASPGAGYLVGLLTTGQNFTGDSLYLYASSQCSAATVWVWNNFQYPYNNNVESAVGYGGCYYGRGYDASSVNTIGGLQYQFPYYFALGSLGTFNNLMSSIKLCGSSC